MSNHGAPAAFTILAAGAALGLARPTPAYEAVPMATGLTDARFATYPPGDTERLVVVQQTGEIRIFDLASRTVLATPFLDIGTLVQDGGEQGLLGLASPNPFTERSRLALAWDGRDDAGRALPAGVYLLRAETETERAGQRLTLLR